MKHIVKEVSVNLNEFDDDDVIEYVACDLGCKVVKPGEDDGERDYTLWPMDDRDELKKHLIHILGISTSSTSDAIIEKVKSILK